MTGSGSAKYGLTTEAPDTFCCPDLDRNQNLLVTVEGDLNYTHELCPNHSAVQSTACGPMGAGGFGWHYGDYAGAGDCYEENAPACIHSLSFCCFGPTSGPEGITVDSEIVFVRVQGSCDPLEFVFQSNWNGLTLDNWSGNPDCFGMNLKVTITLAP